MYGTQTGVSVSGTSGEFENDVKMYGTQTNVQGVHDGRRFENDVKMYGTQTTHPQMSQYLCLRMM